MRAPIAILALALFASAEALALDVGGVTLPDSVQVGGQTLALNGAGLRKKMFVKVYAGGLYLKSKATDADAVVSADAPMSVRMHFIYDGVSPAKLVETWTEGFAASTGGNTAPIADAIAAFNALFDKEAKKGDVYEVSYAPGAGVQVSFNGTVQGTVRGGLAFKKAVFGIWLGDQPADKGLKAWMLGGS